MLNLKKHKLAIFIPALFWAGIIAFGSLWPTSSFPDELKLFNDKFLHSSIYFILNFLLISAIILSSSAENSKIVRWKLYFIISLFSIVYGTLLEYLQDNLNSGRNFELADIAANSIGILFAVIAIALLQRIGFYRYVLSKK